MTGTLYIVATPIGNLEDITVRALKILRAVDMIACEDTRRARILLDRYRIQTPVVSYHQHSRTQKIDYLLDQLTVGKSVALVSEAGIPGISDPGNLLVGKAYEQRIAVVPIPGPSAVTTIASVAGISMDRFLFLGFLPHKKGRQTALRQIAESELPVIFYESPYRILKTVEFLSVLPGYLIIGRELTKKFEEIIRGSPREVFEKLKSRTVRGEFTLIFQVIKS